jgi:carboxypeptidase Taq
LQKKQKQSVVMDKTKIFNKLLDHSKKIYSLVSIEALLSWDLETSMPHDGLANRSNQITFLSGILHSYQTDGSYAKNLSLLIGLKKNDTIKDDTLTPTQKSLLKQWKRDYLQAIKLPTKFVEKFAKATSTATHIWSEAKQNNNFKLFCPYLEKIVDLCIEKANLLGYKDEPYDALIDLYEPGMTTKELTKIFSPLKKQLKELLSKTQKKEIIDDSFLYGKFEKDKQMQMGEKILELMTFSSDGIILDESSHPFSIGLHPTDIRMTTKIYEDYPITNILSVLHEGGHGLYEKNLPTKYFGTPMCESVSLGIHESQSRLWETIIGKSHCFWKYFYPIFQDTFPKQMKNISLDKFYQAINKVQPSLIRIESDEVTYCLHIIVRFEIERDLINKKIKVKDIPKVWNSKMKDILGITPDNDAVGCLQDIHWSCGIIGYFPTYALGNIYAAQLFSKYKKDNTSWKKQLEKGDFTKLERWLCKNIHKNGRYYSPYDLIKKITKKLPSSEDYIKYLNRKFASIYHF